MHRGLPFKKEEGRWSGHSGSSSTTFSSLAGARATPAAPAPPPEVLPRILGVSPPPEHLFHECTNESHGCTRMNATCSLNAMQTAATIYTIFKSL
jgi:hypothetical protein